MHEGPDHKERKFFDWSRAHGLNDDTVFTLLAHNIKRIATLRNTPVDFLNEMDLTVGQKLILKALMYVQGLYLLYNYIPYCYRMHFRNQTEGRLWTDRRPLISRYQRRSNC